MPRTTLWHVWLESFPDEGQYVVVSRNAPDSPFAKREGAAVTVGQKIRTITAQAAGRKFIKGTVESMPASQKQGLVSVDTGGTYGVKTVYR